MTNSGLLKLLNNSKAIGKPEGDKLMKTLKHRENRLHPGLLKEGADNVFNSRNTGNVQNNLRKLFSVNNQYPGIDEGDIFAWQSGLLYTYVAKSNRITILQTNGSSIIQTYNLNFQNSTSKL